MGVVRRVAVGKHFWGSQIRSGWGKSGLGLGFGRVQNFWATFAAFSGGQEGRNGGSRAGCKGKGR